jgi:hypothetical protein
MRKIKFIPLILLLIAAAALGLTAGGCNTGQNTQIPPDPFSVVWGPDTEHVVTFSGNSAGHFAGETSEFTLKLSNKSWDDPWIGSYCVALLDTDGIIKEITHERFEVPSGLEVENTISIKFDEGMEGPYGLSVIMPGRAQSIQTIWIGDTRNVSAGPWPSIYTCPYFMTEEGSFEIAENFLINSPTFQFDGIEDTLKLEETLYPDIENAYQFVFSFDSRHSGYGDREGQALLQVITPHEAVITIERGEIKSAVMDGKWDMKEQKMIDSSFTEEEAQQIATDFVKNSPTFQFDGIEDTLKLIKTAAFSSKTISPEEPASNEIQGWEFTFEFESANAGYGDRTGQAVAEVITPHTAVITVENNKVTSAIMDNIWDMVEQKMIEEEELEIKPAPIHDVEVYIMESYPVQIGVYIKGGLSDGCTTFHDAAVTREGKIVNIKVTTQRPVDAVCPAVYTYFEENINLGSDFTSGETYTLKVNDYTTTFDVP